ncbi:MULTISPECIES: RHS repeat-associated core domain-containing protein [unclassified Bradyrhizobium]|uniref:RHS repeat-associated core domain-containing protein n=1 Tax=unclassified Bradyrhizobium TaxID=2631580 RepID=UPI0028E933CE|nr:MULTISPECIES: RHS repeat-associated core domain-containing protein [unclassified Bradyrhizobium]
MARRAHFAAFAALAAWAAIFFLTCPSLTSARAEETPGALAGNATVSLSGAAQYNIPIVVPVGTAGMTPKLFLSYDSGAGPSSLGLGWSLMGVSSITRSGRTSFLDGLPGPVEFSDRDAFTLDGARLVPAPEGGGFLAKVVDDQSRVEVVKNAEGLSFIVRTKAGLRMYYRTRIKAADGGVLVWACDRIEDTFGNAIIFRYRENGKGDWGLEKVEYSENAQQHLAPYATVEFTYSEIDSSVSFVGGQRIERSLVLNSIESRIQNKRYRLYEIHYKETGRFGSRRIESIAETGADLGTGDLRHRPTTFEYLDPNPTWQKQPDYEIPEGFSVSASLGSGYRFVDLDGDGKSEILYSANLGGRLIASTYKLEAGKWIAKTDLALPTAVSGPAETDAGTIFFDVDGDGYKDLLITRQPVGADEKAYRLANGAKWEKAPQFAFPMPLVVNGQAQAQVIAVKKKDGSSRLMTSLVGDGTTNLWSYQAGQWVAEAVTRKLITPPKSTLSILLSDVDCDGQDDVLILDTAAGTVEVARFNESGGAIILESRGIEKFDGRLASATKVHIGACNHLVLKISKDNNDGVLDVNWPAAAGANLPPATRASIDLTSFGSKVAGVYPANIVGNASEEVLIQLADSPTADIAAFKYDSALSKWTHDATFDYLAPPEARIGGAYIIFPSALQQSGNTDLILLPIAQDRPTFALLNQNPGWKRFDQFVPLIAFAQDKKDAVPLQFVDLNGDGLADLLGYHIDENGVATTASKLNTARGWVDDPRLSLPTGYPMSRSKAGIAGMVIDVTGDGVPDYLYAYAGQHIFRRNAPSNPANVWVEDPALSYAPPEDFSAENLGDLGTRFLDVNGDGRVDLVVARREADGSIHRAAYLNTGSGWVQDTSGRFVPPVPFVSRYVYDVAFETPGAGSAYYRDLRVQLMDLNGDGLLDVVFWYHFSPTMFKEIDRGCLNVPIDDPKSTPEKPLPKIPPKIPESGNCAGAFLNTGKGWAPLAQNLLPPIAFDIDLTDKGAQTDFIDINGDGLVDIVPGHRVGGNNAYGVYLNRGPGWLDASDPAAKSYQLPVEALSTSDKSSSYRLLDLNGDGLVDIAFARPDAKGAFLNTGRGWSARVDSFAPPEAFVDNTGADLGVRLVDVDGNGLPDLLRSWKDKDGAVQKAAYLNVGSRADTMLALTSGTGQRIEFAYRSLLTLRENEGAGTRFYEPSPISEYPVISHVPTMYAVSRLSVVDGPGKRLDTSYRYAGFRFDVISGSVLGFATRFATSFVNSVANIEERVDLYQDYYRNGRNRRETSSYGGVNLSVTENSYEVIATPGGGRMARVVLASTRSENRDLTGVVIGRTAETDTFDAYSNLVDSCVVYGDDSWMFTHNEYLPAAQNFDLRTWFLGRLTRANVTHATKNVTLKCKDLSADASGVPEAEYLSRSAEFRYDKLTGVLTGDTSNVGDPLSVTTEYHHDGFGNVDSTVRSAAEEKSRTSSVEFDPLGRLVVAETNALGYRSTRVLGPILGLVTRITDANGTSGSTSYDAFGQELRSVNPSGLVKRTVREFGAGESVFGVPVAVKVTATIEHLPSKQLWLDLAGRTLRTVSVGFGNRRVFTDYEYDAQGRQITTTLPYFEGDAVFASKTTYDILNRPVQVNRPNGGYTISTYAGLVSTVTELVRAPSNGAPSTTTSRVVKDLKGRVVRTIDAKGGVVDFTFGAADRLIKTVSPGGRTVELCYDRIGNRTETVDPDLGHWQYQYDAFGKIVWQRDARGQTTIIQYDVLGRPLSRRGPDKQATYTYDVGPFAIGRLAFVVGSNGYEETYTYDSSGRVTQKASRVGRQLYGISLVYDANSRVKEVYYPGGYTTFNDYDSLGFLATISAKTPKNALFGSRTAVWKSDERDQYGRVKLETFGNGVKTKHVFSEEAGYEKEMEATREDGSHVSHLSLNYDLAGNLKDKTEHTSGVIEEFTYDPLYRLDGWKVNKKTAATYSYDDAGRIKFKSDMGTFDYTGNGPFSGVKSITTKEGQRQYFTYDGNGNMDFGPKGHFTYDSSNLMTEAYRSNDAWSSFEYSPDGTRYLIRARDHAMYTETTTIGAFERIVEYFSVSGHPDVTRDRIYVSADTGLVAILEEATAFSPYGSSFPPNLIGSKAQFDKIADLTTTVHYITKDQLGSITRITDKRGVVESAFAYDPWGKKCALGGSGLQAPNRSCSPLQSAKTLGSVSEHISGTFHRGFTGHEHLDNLDLIHMNGRVYDPTIARFLSADPQIQSPLYSQNYDRYSYVLNNPLRLVDPSGFGFFGDLWEGIKSVGRAIARPFEQAWHWLERNWKTVVVIAVAAVITVATGGIGGAILAGAISGGLNAALYGGDINDILRGAIIGAAVGAAFYGAGSLGMSVAQASGSQAAGLAVGTLGHGVVGGLQASMQGGNFWSGFGSAAATKAFSPIVESENNVAAETVTAAAIGGTASVIGGGKFEDGAITGAYSQLMNGIAHDLEQRWADDSYFHLNAKIGMFSIDGFTVGAESGSATAGVITQNGAAENIYAVEYDGGLAVSGFKVGDQYGAGLGVGAALHAGPGAVGGQAEGFVLAGGGQAGVGVLVTKTVGVQTSGVGVEVSVQPQAGGATLRALQSLENSIKSAVGFYRMCPQCQ